MHDELRAALEEALATGRADNAALQAIIDDYARYHLVLALVGGLLLAGLGTVSIWSWRRARRTPPRDGRRWTLERTSLTLLALGGAFAALLLGIVVAANISTAVAPMAGFEGAVAGVRSTEGSRLSQVHTGYAEWLRSGAAEAPAEVTRFVDARLAWQAPKAVVTSVLLVLATLAAAWLLRRLARASRSTKGPTRLRALGLVAGLGSVCAAWGLLALMVLGNTQAAVAPVAMTMFFG